MLRRRPQSSMSLGSLCLCGELKSDRIGHGFQEVTDPFRKSGRRHVAIEHHERGERGGEQATVTCVLHRIAEVDPPGGERTNPAAHLDLIVVAGRAPVADGNLADGETESGRLQFTVTHSGPAEVLSTRDVEPDQIAGMIDDAHLIGLGVVDPDPDLRDGGKRHGTASSVVDAQDAGKVTASSAGCGRRRSDQFLAPCSAMPSSSLPTPTSAWRRPPWRRGCWRFWKPCPAWATASSS